MTSGELREILKLPEFKAELQAISSYLASIMQERPIVYLLAKCLWRRKYTIELEAKPCDLVVNDKTRIEFKFNFNRCEGTLKEELERFGHNVPQMRAAASAKELSKSWGVAAKILRDICDDDKRHDIFVWIICSRDLSGVSDVERKRIVVAEAQCKYDALRPYNSDGESLTVIDQFLELVCKERHFSLLKLDIPTQGDFPSTYHFRICDFSKPN